jgi:phytoene dehydrogenase-like protein
VAADDVIVVGGGHNGLVCATLLARAGLGVTVLEANAEPGGCVWTETLPSGHRLERGAIDHSMVIDVAKELGLERFGLTYAPREELVGARFADGDRLLVARDLDETVRRIERTFPGDGERYRRLASVADAVLGLVDQPTPPRFEDVVALASAAPGRVDLVRLLVSSSEAVLAEQLEHPRLRSIVAMAGAHNQLPPWLPGTGIFALLGPSMHASRTARPIGGSSRLTAALVAAVNEQGGRIVTDAPVMRIAWDGERALADTHHGRFSARRVVSSLDLPRTSRLLGEAPQRLRRAARSMRSGAFNVAELKVDLALDRPVNLDPGAGAEALWLLQEHEGSLAAAFGDILTGRLPRSPAMMWASPSASDPSAAPEGEGVVWLSAFVPARLEGGTWDEGQDERATEWLLEGFRRVTGVDLGPSIRERRVTSPRLWRERIGTDNPNHLDLTLDQLFSWRSQAGDRPYRTPLPWLYLTGAGTYPGGGLSGIPGRNTARALLADVRGARGAGTWRAGARRELRALRRAGSAYLAMRRLR